MQFRWATFQILIEFLETVQARESSEDSSTARIPVEWPNISTIEMLDDSAGPCFSSLEKKQKVRHFCRPRSTSRTFRTYRFFERWRETTSRALVVSEHTRRTMDPFSFHGTKTKSRILWLAVAVPKNSNSSPASPFSS